MKNLIKVVISVTVASSIALAMPSAKEKFSKADVNNDGILSSTEFYNDRARKMEQKIGEGKALKGTSTAPRFNMVDKNKDGKVTFAEYDKFHTKRQEQMKSIRNSGMGKGKGLEAFNRYDKDGNGCINKNEFRELFQNMRSKKL